MAHGAALPIFVIYFGDLTDGFILQAVSTNISDIVAAGIENGTARLADGMENATTIDCSSSFHFLLNGNYSPPLTITSILQSSDSRFADAECLLDDAFIDNINIYTYAFVGIAVAVWLVSLTQIFTFQFTSERQVHRIRLKYYRAIMRQDIAWFDENPTGALVTRLSE